METASILENLKEEGWNLTPAALETLSDNGKITDVKNIIRKAIDVDLRTISNGGFPEDITKTKYEQIPGNIVLQIQKIKNLSSPKSSEFKTTSQPTIIKLTLTDGMQNMQAIEMEMVQNINVNTYPGSKILLTEAVDISHCYLLLFNSNTKFLGGKVDTLVEKWELNRSLAKHTRDRLEEGGPPPWIPFGQKIVKQNLTDKNFKSLDQNKLKEVSENTEFEEQRKGAILEATKIGSTKVFGGGNNKLLDYNVRRIVEAGFSIEQAEYALKLSKNNLDRALRSIQTKHSKPSKEEGKPGGSKTEDKRAGKGRGRHRDEEGASSLKPSGAVSLFEFLEDKLPISDKEAFSTDTRNNFDKRYTNGVKTSRPNNPERSTPERNPPFKKPFDSTRPFPKFESDRKRPDFAGGGGGRVENNSNGNSRPPRNDTRPFKKFEEKPGEYGRNEMLKNRVNDRRGPSAGYANKNTTRVDGVETKKQTNFVQNNVKPPRFQKTQNQYGSDHGPGLQSWSDSSYNRLQSEFQLQSTMASLSLQHSIANFQSPQDSYQDTMAGLQQANTNKSAMFYQNMVMPPAPPQQSADTRLYGTPAHSQPPAHLNSYNTRGQGFIPPDMKNSPYSTMPNLPECAYKNNGAILPGYNDFQSVFGSPRAPPMNNYTSAAQYVPQPPKRWQWNKGDKCMAKYWEDHMFYNAVVTAVSENTCVVRFTEYGNFEEVLHENCIPITEES